MAQTKGDGFNQYKAPSFKQPSPPKLQPTFKPDKKVRDDDPRRAVRPPALAPRGKDAVQVFNRAQQDADTRARQSQAVADMYNNMAARQRTAELRTAREAKDRKETGTALTQEEWEKFSPLQQAVTQANADLAGAIKRDMEDSGKHHATTAQIQTYMDQVKDLFGEDGSVGFKGVEYAPNTLTFLKERGIGKDDLVGKTLDDFISGDTLVTTETVNALGQKPAPMDAFRVQDQDTSFAARLAKGQMQYQEKLAEKLAKGDRLIADLTGHASSKAATDAFGAKEQPRLQLPNVRPETAAQIDLYMEALARSDSPIDQALTAINLDLQQRGASSQETDQIYQELVNRSRQGMTGEGKWFDGIDFPMRSPVEVAQALGTPTLKREATTSGSGR